ncbi:hypothetical protein [Streptomyces sp. NPDC003077]|uniref:hypothetical protein n=1 Tax=Streptomyces sp. NPDC003077 TaxID=3154443 RepID=UPI0033B484B9
MRKLLGAAACAAILTGSAVIAPAGRAEAGPAPRVERVSTAADGAQLDGTSRSATLSADGRYAAFWIKEPDGYFHQLMLKDLVTGALTRVPGGVSYGTHATALSADGRYLGFGAGTYRDRPRLYDRVTGEVREVWPQQGAGGFEYGSVTSLSADGRYAAMVLWNRNGNSPDAVFVRDLVTGADERISPSDMPGRTPYATGGGMSTDGRYVAFGVVQRTQDVPDPADVFVRDRATGEVRQIDVTHDGAPADGPSRPVAMSAGGRYVFFHSSAGNLLPEPATGEWGYVRDLRTGGTERVGAEGDRIAAVSGDGRRVLLARGGGLRLLDRNSGAETVVAAEGTAVPGAFGARGRAVLFSSAAADLVPGDTNGVSDVFAYRARGHQRG